MFEIAISVDPLVTIDIVNNGKSIPCHTTLWVREESRFLRGEHVDLGTLQGCPISQGRESEADM